MIRFKEYGIYQIVDYSMRIGADYMDTDLGYGEWDNEVENVDSDSDYLRYCGVSLCLRWNEVILTPKIIYAPNQERLREALRHVVFKMHCPGDI